MTVAPKPWWQHLLEALAGLWTDSQLARAGAGRDALRGSVSTLQDLPTGYDLASEEEPVRRAIVAFLEANVGDPYTYGAEIRLDDPDPDTGDCSEYGEQAYVRAGKHYPDGVVNQRAHCRGRRVAQPKPGDPFFLRPNKNGIPHTGYYVGDGMIIHADGGAARKVVKVPMAWAEAHPRFEGWFRHPELAWPQEDRA